MAATLVFAACSGDDSTSPANTRVLARATPSGDAQTGTAGAALANPLRVLVTEDGDPVEGLTVTWGVVSGGGSVSATSSTTGADGVASITWTLGGTAGAQSVRATAPSASGSPLTFTATATAGAATAVASSSPVTFNGGVGSQNPGALRVLVRDAFGNPVSGTAVEWTVTGGTATLSSSIVATNAAGISQVGVTLPVAGTSTIEAEVTGLSGSPVTFTVNAIQVQGTADVEIRNDFFTPVSVTVPVGTMVTWTLVNTGISSHNVTSTGQPAFTGSDVLTGNGASYSFLFVTPGTYAYTCTLHAGMSGTVTVQ
jgi:plastocyanin